MNKIIGIGLPKSGTSSLHEALKLLGFRSRHFAYDKYTETELRSANYRLSVLQRYDAVMDNPIPAVFAQLDEAWPESKFILTVRPIDKWIESTRRAGFNQPYARSKRGSRIDFYQTLQFGCNVFSESRYRWIYRSHHKLVQDYFSGAKANQLLVMDVTAGDGWEKLCPFLNKSVPDIPFPHANPLSARSELTPFQQATVGLLVKSGIDYAWLRRKWKMLTGK